MLLEPLFHLDIQQGHFLPHCGLLSRYPAYLLEKVGYMLPRLATDRQDGFDVGELLAVFLLQGGNDALLIL